VISKLEGIVIKAFRYGETSMIAHVYTRENGMQSVMIKGAVGGKNSKASMLQPMSHVGLVVYQKNAEQSLMLLKEIEILTVYHAIGFDFIKNAIVLFCSELLHKTLREQAASEFLFQFLVQTMRTLDREVGSVVNHHLFFMIRLAEFLGIGITASQVEPPFYFDYIESSFDVIPPFHSDFLQPEQAQLLHHLIEINESELPTKISNTERRQGLEIFITYYRHHVNDFGKLHSYEVLQTLFA
jgi:DNA repair protein RecO (recombination protein O)